MKIPETPSSVEQLDLMQLLDSYATGAATWHEDGSKIGKELQQSCRSLHTHIVELVTQVFAFILDRINAREMDIFTMHDRRHGAKVAHLMWHITTPERRKRLSPAEIALLVLAAYIHDAGMALTRKERELRLSGDSDLWLNLENMEEAKRSFFALRERLKDSTVNGGLRARLELEFQQAEEALLTNDTRLRHATPDRYKELFNLLSEFHSKDQVRIPDIERGMSFDGESFKSKLIDICVSHNESAEVLVERDRENFQNRRFPRVFPIGRANADLQFVAAALRLADILDFDRERTPSLLFYYLVPGGFSIGENLSLLEWSKHLAISNWEITEDEVIFRGRCSSHIVHHAVVQFCKQIEDEIGNTRSSFSTLEEQDAWPFILPWTIKPDIFAEGYIYVPYSFKLDDARIYQLLMGGAIYDNPLVAIRELIQNAVDACKLRDALTELYEESVKPAKRIIIRYEDPTVDRPYPLLIIRDTGTGMDKWLLERWFLQVGRSYYSSSDFNKTRVQLRARGLDFAPVSEFGIGFLSCFLLADRVEVETAMWEPVRGDTAKRHLTIDGPTRLIRVKEDANQGVGRFKGTSVKLHLCRGSRRQKLLPPLCDEIWEYIEFCCVELPYNLVLEHDQANNREIVPCKELEMPLVLREQAIKMTVKNTLIGLSGEIALAGNSVHAELEAAKVAESLIAAKPEIRGQDVLIRGGFRVGEVPGLPTGAVAYARVCQTWQQTQDRRYGATNLARTNAASTREIAVEVTNTWVRHLIQNRSMLPKRLAWDIGLGFNISFTDLVCLDDFSLLDLYEFARQGWIELLKRNGSVALGEWESGNGKPLMLRTYGDLWSSFIGRILPVIIQKMAFDPASGCTLIYPPSPGWRESLKILKDCRTRGIDWPVFVEYPERMQDVLFMKGNLQMGLNFNIACKDGLIGFNRQDIMKIYSALKKLLDGHLSRTQVHLDSGSIELIRRAYLGIKGYSITTEQYPKKFLKISELGLKF